MKRLPIRVLALTAVGSTAPATLETFMTKAHRLILVCATLLLVVGQAWAGTSTHWALGPDGRMTSSTLQSTGDENTSWFWDCSLGWANCDLCASCHRSTTIDSQPFTAKKHEAGYFPRFQLRVAPGKKVPFGTQGEYLVADGLSMVKLTAGGQKIFTFPPTAVLLKNSAGQPTFVMSTSPPAIHTRR